MRIISQDGTIDVNYDLGNLSIAKGADDSATQRSIYFHSCSCPRSTKLATYSTAEKAKDAMEMLNGAYMAHSVYMSLETNEKTDFEREMVKDGFCKEYLYGLFKFPQDSEIEV